MDIARDLQTIAHQERVLTFPQFHADEAWQLGTQHAMGRTQGEHDRAFSSQLVCDRLDASAYASRGDGFPLRVASAGVLGADVGALSLARA